MRLEFQDLDTPIYLMVAPGSVLTNLQLWGYLYAETGHMVDDKMHAFHRTVLAYYATTSWW